MAQRYRLGLTRNRLFEFDNCVCFSGKLQSPADEKAFDRALKMLCIKEPLVSARIQLGDDSEAFVVTDSVIQHFIKSDISEQTLFLEKSRSGLDFTKGLFEFYLLHGDTLVIFAHTAVADVKSLFVLAGELLAFSQKTTVNIEPADVLLFSEKEDLSPRLFSPLVESVTAQLEEKWQKNPRVFGESDYESAREAFAKTHREDGISIFTIPKEIAIPFKEKCSSVGVDAAVYLCRAFLSELSRLLKGNKKYCKAAFGVDRRLYLDNGGHYGVGPFSAYVQTDSPSLKNVKNLGADRAFQKEVFDKYMSAFYAFYDDVFLVKLSPAFCDGAFMYEAGLYKNRSVSRLAQVYTCLSKRIMSFDAYNLDQASWAYLDGFSDITAFEPFKKRDDTAINVIMKNGEIKITVHFNKEKLGSEQVNGIFESIKAKITAG